jgi:GTP-binding protein
MSENLLLLMPPGKTRALNVYTCRIRRRIGHDYFREGSLQMVDLPGYGYARVSKTERGKWGPLIEGYLTDRSSVRDKPGNSGLWGVALVIDGRRPPMESDIQMADWLGQQGIHFIALLTKSDKLNQSEKTSVWSESEGLLISLGARAVFQISSSKGTGILDVWPALYEMGR